MCATGAIYAIRRSLFEPIPADTILDDVLIPLRLVKKGYAVLFEPGAKASGDGVGGFDFGGAEVEDAEEELAERATPSTVRQRKSVGDAGVVVSGDDGLVDGLYTKLARCCTPVPGDEILGFVTRGGGVSVHRTDCTNAKELLAEPERLVDVEWAPSDSSVFLVAIQVEALDRRIVAVQADVRDEAGLRAAFEAGVAELGPVDIVLANAGIAPMSLGEEPHEAWQDVIDVNLTGVFNTVEIAVPSMIERGAGGAIVLTTGNKSEMGTGYATLYGDMAGGFGVLKDIGKLLVYRLSEYRNSVSPVIPQRVLDRAPSAELKPEQTDQDSLPPYSVLDPILEAYVEDDMSPADIISRGFARSDVESVVRLVRMSEYKRRQAPPGVKITSRAFGRDRRYPITNGFKAPRQ